MTDQEKLDMKMEELKTLQLETFKYMAITLVLMAETLFAMCMGWLGIFLFSFVVFLVSKNQFEHWHDLTKACLEQTKKILKKVYPERNE